MVISFLQRHPKAAAGHILAEENLGSLLIEILELYGTRFNFERVGIAVDKGGFYFDTLQYHRTDDKMWTNICIRDPNDPNNNVAKASYQVENIIRLLADTYRELTNRCYIVHSEIQNGKTECGSILASVISPLHFASRQRKVVPSAIRTVPESTIQEPPQKKQKTNRAERRALQRAKEKEEREQKKIGKAERETAPPTKSNPPGEVTLARTASDGSKVNPISIEDFQETTSLPAPRKRRLSAGISDMAAANLRATGSITGIKRNPISIE
jgi:DNA polymerase sigma